MVIIIVILVLLILIGPTLMLASAFEVMPTFLLCAVFGGIIVFILKVMGKRDSKHSVEDIQNVSNEKINQNKVDIHKYDIEDKVFDNEQRKLLIKMKEEMPKFIFTRYINPKYSVNSLECIYKLFKNGYDFRANKDLKYIPDRDLDKFIRTIIFFWIISPDYTEDQILAIYDILFRESFRVLLKEKCLSADEFFNYLMGEKTHRAQTYLELFDQDPIYNFKSNREIQKKGEEVKKIVLKIFDKHNTINMMNFLSNFIVNDNLLKGFYSAYLEANNKQLIEKKVKYIQNKIIYNFQSKSSYVDMNSRFYNSWKKIKCGSNSYEFDEFFNRFNLKILILFRDYVSYEKFMYIVEYGIDTEYKLLDFVCKPNIDFDSCKKMIQDRKQGHALSEILKDQIN